MSIWLESMETLFSHFYIVFNLIYIFWSILQIWFVYMPIRPNRDGRIGNSGDEVIYLQVIIQFKFRAQVCVWTRGRLFGGDFSGVTFGKSHPRKVTPGQHLPMLNQHWAMLPGVTFWGWLLPKVTYKKSPPSTLLDVDSTLANVARGWLFKISNF